MFLKIYFLILIYFLTYITCRFVKETENTKNILELPVYNQTSSFIPYTTITPNVGSELFCYPQTKQCWSLEDQLLLNSRRIFQDLIPIKMLDVSNGAFVEYLIHYIRLCLDEIDEVLNPKVRYALRLAMMDTFGGYLRMYALPIAKQAYYSGKVNYEMTSDLFNTWDEIKATLRTDGLCWTRPIELTTAYVHTDPINLEYNFFDENPCSNLVIHGWDESQRNSNDEIEKKPLQSSALPLPFFDSQIKPSALAVPFKDHLLRNIRYPESAEVLQTYYINAMKCFKYMHLSNKEIYIFNRRFHKWICQQVFPLLFEEEWYPAFHGIYQILTEMHKYNLGDSDNNYGCLMRTPEPKKQHIIHDEFTVKPVIHDNEPSCETGPDSLEASNEPQLDIQQSSDIYIPSITYIGLAIIVILGIWGMVGCLIFLTRRLTKTKKQNCEDPMLRFDLYSLFNRKGQCPSKKGNKKTLRRKKSELDNEEDSVIGVFRYEESDVSKDLGFSSETATSSISANIWSTDLDDSKGRNTIIN